MDSYPQEHANAPLFSICLTTLNDRDDLLRQTLAGIFSQTFKDFEVVIGNNNPERPLTSGMLGIDDARVRIINHPQNLGQLGNLSRLLELGRGRYVTFIADDDLYAPDFLAAMHAALTRFDFPSCIFTAYHLHYGSSQPVMSEQLSWQATLYSGADFIRGYLMEQIKAIGSMGMFEIEYLKRTGGIEDVSADGIWVYLEYMLLIRAGLLEKVAHIPDPLIYYRIHEGAWGVANTDLDRYFHAGEALVLKSAEVLTNGFRGVRAETLLLIFNLALKQLLFKTGQRNLPLDVGAMLEKVDNELAITSGNKTVGGRHEIYGLRADIVSLLLQQFADAETGRISKEQEIFSLKADCNSKDEEINSLKGDCNTKDEEIRSLKKICEERETVIFQLDHRVKFLERTNLIGKGLLLVRSALILAWAPLRRGLAQLLTPKLGVLRQYPPRPLILTQRDAQTGSPARPPKISIVTPSYNQAAYLERTLRSVVEQGYPDLEYIVQDGGSQDGSVEILERYADRLAFWESNKDKGQTNAINLGFRHASGEIMAYLNSDDLLLPGALAYVATYFENHPEVDVVYGHRIIIDENDQEIGRWILPPHDDQVLSWADFIPQETLFWRRRAWDKIGASLDESFHFAMDWDLLLRLRDSGARFVRLPRFLAAFRVHPQQKTSAEINAVGFFEMNRLRERCHGRSVTDGEIRMGVASYLMRHVLYNKFNRVLAK